jgi:ribonuclease R
MTNNEMQERILGYVKEHAAAPLEAEAILKALQLEGADLKLFWLELKELEDNGTLIKTRCSTYGLPAAMGLVVGRIQITSKGFGFVIPAEKTEEGDLFIPASGLTGSMDGDTVIARVMEKAMTTGGKARSSGS